MEVISWALWILCKFHALVYHSGLWAAASHLGIIFFLSFPFFFFTAAWIISLFRLFKRSFMCVSEAAVHFRQFNNSTHSHSWSSPNIFCLEEQLFPCARPWRSTCISRGSLKKGEYNKAKVSTKGDLISVTGSFVYIFFLFLSLPVSGTALASLGTCLHECSRHVTSVATIVSRCWNFQMLVVCMSACPIPLNFGGEVSLAERFTFRTSTHVFYFALSRQRQHGTSILAIRYL